MRVWKWLRKRYRCWLWDICPLHLALRQATHCAWCAQERVNRFNELHGQNSESRKQALRQLEMEADAEEIEVLK